MSKTGKRKPPIGHPKKTPTVGPLDTAHDRCESFASGMLTSYYLHSLHEMLVQAEIEGMLDSLEVRLSLQIMFDAMLPDDESPN